MLKITFNSIRTRNCFLRGLACLKSSTYLVVHYRLCGTVQIKLFKKKNKNNIPLKGHTFKNTGMAQIGLHDWLKKKTTKLGRVGEWICSKHIVWNSQRTNKKLQHKI